MFDGGIVGEEVYRYGLHYFIISGSMHGLQECHESLKPVLCALQDSYLSRQPNELDTWVMMHFQD